MPILNGHRAHKSSPLLAKTTPPEGQIPEDGPLPATPKYWFSTSLDKRLTGLSPNGNSPARRKQTRRISLPQALYASSSFARNVLVDENSFVGGRQTSQSVRAVTRCNSEREKTECFLEALESSQKNLEEMATSDNSNQCPHAISSFESLHTPEDINFSPDIHFIDHEKETLPTTLASLLQGSGPKDDVKEFSKLTTISDAVDLSMTSSSMTCDLSAFEDNGNRQQQAAYWRDLANKARLENASLNSRVKALSDELERTKLDLRIARTEVAYLGKENKKLKSKLVTVGNNLPEQDSK